MAESPKDECNDQALPPNFYTPDAEKYNRYDGSLSDGKYSNDGAHWHPPVKKNKG